MAFKVQIDGPFSKQQAQEFIEDIANTENYIISTIQCIPKNNLYDVMVCYDNGVTATKSKTTKRSVKS